MRGEERSGVTGEEEKIAGRESRRTHLARWRGATRRRRGGGEGSLTLKRMARRDPSKGKKRRGNPSEIYDNQKKLEGGDKKRRRRVRPDNEKDEVTRGGLGSERGGGASDRKRIIREFSKSPDGVGENVLLLRGSFKEKKAQGGGALTKDQ